jgi:ABC-type amino acid transport substrate-binding protein
VSSRRRAWTLAATALALAGAAWAGDPGGVFGTPERLRVAVPDRDEPPFVEYGPDGRPGGFDLALAGALAAALGVDLQVVPAPGGRDGVLAEVRAGRVEIGLAGLGPDLSTARAVSFSRPYATPRRALLYNRRVLAREAPTRAPHVLLERVGTTVAVVRDDPVIQYLALAFDGVRPVAFPDPDSATRAVLAGEPPVLLSDRARLRRWLARQAGLGLELGYWEPPAAPGRVVAALPWRAAWLHGWLEGALQILEDEGTLEALRASYLEGRAP